MLNQISDFRPLDPDYQPPARNFLGRLDPEALFSIIAGTLLAIGLAVFGYAVYMFLWAAS